MIFKVFKVFRKKTVFQSGFTLVEVMVVIAIIAIMSGIAIPNFISWLPDYRLRSAARDIVSCMQLTKLRAVKENANAIVVFGSNTYEAFFDNGAGGGNAGDRTKDAGEPGIKNAALPAGIELSNNNGNSAATLNFGFSSKGLSTGNGTLLIENNKSNSITIALSNAGNIHVE